MRHNLLRPTLFVLTILLFACTGSKELVGLRYNLEEGNAYKQEQTITQAMSYTMMGMPIDQKTTTITNTTHKVKAINEAGNFLTDVTYDRVRSTSEAMGQTQTYDSDTDTTRGADVLARNPQGFLVGNTITTEMTPNGEIVAIEGLQQMVKQMFGEDAAGNDLSKSAFLEMFNEEQMKRNFGQASNIYPEDSVQVGDTWTTKMKIEKPMPMQTDMTYTLKDAKPDVFVLGLEGTLSTGENGAIDMGGQKVDVTMDGTMSGELTVDRATGWILQSRLVQDAKGKMNIKGIQADMNIKTTTEITGKK